MARVTARMLGGIGIFALAVSGCTASGPASQTSTSVSAPPTKDPKGDGTLVLAGLLERTGGQAAAHQAQSAAIHLAVNEINASDGVSGTPVTVVDSDAASATLLTDLQTAKVDVTIGTPSEALLTTLAATRLPGVWTAPPTATQLTQAIAGKDVVLTARPELQVRALAQALHQDGRQSIGVIGRNDDPGKAAVEELTAALDKAELTLATDPVYYQPGDASFTVPVTKVKGAGPDAIVVLGGDEAAAVLPELTVQGIGPATVPVYVAGPSVSALTGLPKGSLAGVKVAGPGSEVGEEFRQQLVGLDPGLTSFSGASEAYDATVLAALAATAAGDDDGGVVLANVAAASSDGTECTSYAQCVKLLADSKDIRYVGRSGPSALGDEGFRRAGQVAITQFDDQNAATGTAYVTVT